MNEKYALGVDIGGSHIACQVVELDSSRPVGETYTEVKIAENESAQKILAAWDSALGACMQKAGARAITGLGVAMPSPFDFIKGIAMAEHKFASIKGMNVRAELHRLTGIDPSRILFTNDAAGFGMGAWSLGGGNARHLIGVTLGTGFGACFIVDGCYATYGPGVPIGGELWDYPFRGRIAEDFVSTRWFEEKFRQITGVAITGVKPMIDYYHADKYTAEVRPHVRRDHAAVRAALRRRHAGGGRRHGARRGVFLPAAARRFRTKGRADPGGGDGRHDHRDHRRGGRAV